MVTLDARWRTLDARLRGVRLGVLALEGLVDGRGGETFPALG